MSDETEARPRTNSQLAFDVNQHRPRVGCILFFFIIILLATIKTYRCDGCDNVLDERQIEEHMKQCIAGTSYNNFHEITTDEFLEESKDPFSLPLTYIDETKKEDETPHDGEGENPDGNNEETPKEEPAPEAAQ